MQHYVRIDNSKMPCGTIIKSSGTRGCTNFFLSQCNGEAQIPSARLFIILLT